MQRHRQHGFVEALVTGREQLIERVPRPQAAASEEAPREQTVREHTPGTEPPAPPPVRRTNVRRELIEALVSREALRRAIVLHEVLGPPKALQP